MDKDSTNFETYTAPDEKLVRDGEITTAQLEGELKKSFAIAQKLLEKGISIQDMSDATALAPNSASI